MSEKDHKSDNKNGIKKGAGNGANSNGDEFEIESINPTDEAPKSEKGADEDLKKAQAEAAQWKNDYLYLRADFDNYRKSVIKERADLVKYGCERLIVELLEFLDTFERALELPITSENVGQFKSGIDMTAAKLREVLGQFGVKELPAAGVAFNPSEHEALSSEETNTLAPGHVLRVFKKAYKLHDRVIRPAQVVVAKEMTPKEG